MRAQTLNLSDLHTEKCPSAPSCSRGHDLLKRQQWVNGLEMNYGSFYSAYVGCPHITWYAGQINLTHTLSHVQQAANIHTRFNRRKIIIIFALAKELQCVSWRKKCASEKVWIYFFSLRVWCTAPTFVHGRVTLFCSLMRPNAQSRTLNRNLSTLLAKLVVSKLLKSIVALKKRVH